VRIAANQPIGRFYDGGRRISDFRSEPPSLPYTPEDWVASTTSVRGQSPVGLTRLAGGKLLADAVAADPVGWLGPDHTRRYGPDTMLLVKLLDAGQRLPVHAHPDRSFAAEHLAAHHGKAEAWYLLGPGTVYLGLRETVAPGQLRELVDAQDTARLLALLNPIEVDTGDTVFVPAGTLHAIGAGVLLAEVQEPEDLSILLEWKGFDLDGAADGHLGLGFDLALRAVTHESPSGDRVAELVGRGLRDGPVLPRETAPFFRLDRIASPRTLPAGLSIIIGLTGSVTLATSGDLCPCPRGSTTLVPFGAGPLTFTGEGSVLVARPPAA
jgi:mannose-6-phosphate isomerase